MSKKVITTTFIYDTKYNVGLNRAINMSHFIKRIIHFQNLKKNEGKCSLAKFS